MISHRTECGHENECPIPVVGGMNISDFCVVVDCCLKMKKKLFIFNEEEKKKIKPF